MNDFSASARLTATDVGRSFRAIRRARRLSQRELAAASRICPSTIAAFESGRRVPSLSALSVVLNATGYRLAIVDVSDDATGRPGDDLLVPDDEHDAIRDRGGRRFPAHLRWSGKPDYAVDPSWWGWHRVAWYFSDDPAVPDHVYWGRRRPGACRRDPREHPFWN